MTRKMAMTAAAVAAAMLLLGAWGVRVLASPDRQSAGAPASNEPVSHELRTPEPPLTPEEQASAIPMPKGGKAAVPHGLSDPNAPIAKPAER